MRPRGSIADFGHNGEAGSSPSLTKAFLRVRVVAAGVDMSVAAIVKRVQQGLNIFWFIPMSEPGRYGLIADLLFFSLE